MKSAWWWGTSEWAKYEDDYYAGKVRPDEFKSSPLANDHDFSDAEGYVQHEHQTQVIDLQTHTWRDVRKSYHSLIHRGQERYHIRESLNYGAFEVVHRHANGASVRPRATYQHQSDWGRSDNALLLTALKDGNYQAFVLWIIYQECAYYASAPSLEPNVQHAVIWRSLELLKEKGIRLVEMGQIDGETEKEKNIGKFKAGFGGTVMPFTIARRSR